MSWIELYDFEINKERTIKLLKKFGIDKYHFIMINGLMALLIDINLNTYRIELLPYENEAVIRKKQVTRKGARHSKEYMRIVQSFNDDICYQCIKWIAEDSGIYRT